MQADGSTVYYSTVTGQTYGSHEEASAADGAAGGTNTQAGSSGDPATQKAAAEALVAQKGPGYSVAQDAAGNYVARLTDPASAQLGYTPGQQSPAPSSASTAPQIPGVGQPGGPATPAPYGGAPVTGAPAVVYRAPAPAAQSFQAPVQRNLTPIAPRPAPFAAANVDTAGAKQALSAYGAGAPAPAAPTSVANPTPPAYASVDWQPYNTALQGLQSNSAALTAELDRLSGGDPFGNEAFLQQATNRAQATAMGTAASARGGPAALAGANRVAQGVQTQLQAQGAEQMGQQRAQDAVQSAGIRATDLKTQADLSTSILNTTTDLTKAASQVGVANVNSWLQKYGIDTSAGTEGAKIAQDNVDNLRNAAVEYAKVDQARYNTDMQYRQSVDDNITKKYLGDTALQAAMAQIKQGQKLTFKDILMGVLDAGAGIVTAGAKASDSRLKTDIRDPDLHDLAKFLETKAYRYKYKNEKHGSGEFFGPMAQDLLRSKAGSAAVVHTSEGLMVDTGRLALADHAALSVLAEQVKKLAAKRSKKS
jgi:hypothetical protein